MHTYQLTHQHACQRLTCSSTHTLTKFGVLFSSLSQFHTSFPAWLGANPGEWVFVGWRGFSVPAGPVTHPNWDLRGEVRNSRHVVGFSVLRLWRDFSYILGVLLSEKIHESYCKGYISTLNETSLWMVLYLVLKLRRKNNNSLTGQTHVELTLFPRHFNEMWNRQLIDFCAQWGALEYALRSTQ